MFANIGDLTSNVISSEKNLLLLTKNILKQLTTYSADLPNRPKYLEYLTHWVSGVRGMTYIKS